jgi:glycerol-3-phosphate dehydrogenase
MRRDLAALTETHFDLLVIGGGIFGACAAWDAAQRGLSVALIERHDFGSATSAYSFKMIHGGIRYIQHGDVWRVRQSSHERRAFLRIAPHLVRPLPIVIPTYGHGMKGKTVLRLGMGLYDTLTADRNRGIADPVSRIPWGRALNRDEVLHLFPGLKSGGLTGAGVFCDGQMYNPPRLVLAFLQSAARQGAVVANYVEATGFRRDGDDVRGVLARDVLTDAELEIRASVVINAAGPYAERLLQRAAPSLQLPVPGVYSRDACFVIPRRLFEHEHALAILGRTHDPEAVLSRGERHLFVVPWRDFTLVGVWHKVHGGDPDQFTVTDGELEQFIDELNAGYPSLDLSMDDVAQWNAGLVPFGDNPEGAVNLRYGHRSRLIDHRESHGVDNLITLIGVRFTTGRYEAERAVNLALRKLDRKAIRSQTTVTPLVGGQIDDWRALLREVIGQHGDDLGENVIRSLLHNYGSEYGRVIAEVQQTPGLGGTVGGTSTIKAQIHVAVRDEMAVSLSDVVFRRTDMATGGYPGRAALSECAQIMGELIAWSPRAAEDQIEEVVGRFAPRMVRATDLAKPERTVG